MRDASRTENSLRELNLMWRVIESTAKMNCPEESDGLLPMMAATRQGFQRLESELVASLVRQNVANVMAGIGTKAQRVIDLIVRNLFERTADVGFLATDVELCGYMAGTNGTRAEAVERLRAYRAKYTVYEEIVLLDTDGRVMANLDTASPAIEQCSDAFVARTLASDTYVETFGPCSLRPGNDKSLVYSRRMLHPVSRQVVGLLCLVFGFEGEMAGIFDSCRGADRGVNLLLLYANGKVIASADAGWIPLGAVVPVNASRSIESLPEPLLYNGRKYLAQTFASSGYQGYPGPPGWQAQVMVPLDLAFETSASVPGGNSLASIDETLADGLLTHAATFSPPLHEVLTAADTIRRVVWNGQVMTVGKQRDTAKLEAVLEQISETGARSDEVFSGSIRTLYGAALASGTGHATFMTGLMVELLDRNLYERSDDCRWWAMTAALRRALAKPAAGLGVAVSVELGVLLSGINALYTVYTRLVAYDRNGVIVAASTRPGYMDDIDAQVVGSTIEPDTLAAVLALPDSQAYHVTDFVPSPLYGGKPTYVYHAAVRGIDNDQVVGGIGIVFDSAPEFDAMLRSALGSDATSTAVFVDRNGRVIASTDRAQPVGSTLPLPADVAALPNGSSMARVLVRDDSYTLMSCSVSHGYREFKRSDGYKDDVLALTFRSLGEVRDSALTEQQRRESAIHDNPTGGTRSDYATFFIGTALYAIAAAKVLEALPAVDVKPVALGKAPYRVGMLARQRKGRVGSYAWVHDLQAGVGARQQFASRSRQVVMLRNAGQDLGLVVDALHSVSSFDDSQVSPTPWTGSGMEAVVSDLIRANDGQLLIQILDVDRLCKLFIGSDTAPVPATVA